MKISSEEKNIKKFFIQSIYKLPDDSDIYQNILKKIFPKLDASLRILIFRRI